MNDDSWPSSPLIFFFFFRWLYMTPQDDHDHSRSAVQCFPLCCSFFLSLLLILLICHPASCYCNFSSEAPVLSNNKKLESMTALYWWMKALVQMHNADGGLMETFEICTCVLTCVCKKKKKKNLFVVVFFYRKHIL